MDEGLPIAYQVLERSVPVYASGGEQVGTVDHVVAAPEQDIFHGVVMTTPGGKRFVPAEEIASLHEMGVDLRIDAAAADALEAPHGSAPTWAVAEPGVKPSRWSHVIGTIAGRDPRARDWNKQG